MAVDLVYGNVGVIDAKLEKLLIDLHKIRHNASPFVDTSNVDNSRENVKVLKYIIPKNIASACAKRIGKPLLSDALELALRAEFDILPNWEGRVDINATVKPYFKYYVHIVTWNVPIRVEPELDEVLQDHIKALYIDKKVYVYQIDRLFRKIKSEFNDRSKTIEGISFYKNRSGLSSFIEFDVEKPEKIEVLSPFVDDEETMKSLVEEVFDRESISGNITPYFRK